MVGRKGNLEQGMIILSFVMMAVFIVAAMATQTTTIFSSFSSSEWGLIGFVVKYFNVILFVGLTLAMFIGFKALGGSS